jgi:hypothetical protein
MDLEANRRWFEELCDSLSRNPAEATASLMQFRNSGEAALELAPYLLQRCAARPDAQFQAALVLKHSMMKRWKLMAPQRLRGLQSFLWNFISTQHSSCAPYVLGKVIQV